MSELSSICRWTHYSSRIVTLLWMSQRWMNIGDQWSLPQASRQNRPWSKNECRLGALCWPLLAYLISEIDSAWVQGRWQALPQDGHEVQRAPCLESELRESIATCRVVWSRRCRNSWIRTYMQNLKLAFINPLKPSGHYMYRTAVTICTTSLTFTIPRSAHTVYLSVLCGFQNKQRLFPYTTLTDWFL